jgi:parallel beta-helix repeat protein
LRTWRLSSWETALAERERQPWRQPARWISPRSGALSLGLGLGLLLVACAGPPEGRGSTDQTVARSRVSVGDPSPGQVPAVPAVRPSGAGDTQKAIQSSGIPEGKSAAVNVPETTVRHVDASLGDDNADGTEARPWRSLARASRALVQSRVTVLLRCGRVWRETLSLAGNRGESSGGRRIGAYGDDCRTGNLPEINGADLLPAPRVVGEGVVEAAVVGPVYQVHWAGKLLREARYPAQGFLRIDAAAQALEGGRRAFRSNALVAVAGADLGGVRMHIRTNTYTMETVRVASVSPRGDVELIEPTRYPIEPGFGFYLENSRWMLALSGDWHFDAERRRLSLLPPQSSPTDGPVEATTRENGIQVSALPGLLIEGIRIRNSGGVAIAVNHSPGLQLRSLEIVHAGLDGIRIEDSVGAVVAGNMVSGSGRDGIVVARSARSVISGNVINDTAVLGSPRSHFAAINATDSDEITIEGNTIRNTGYHGIRFKRKTRVARNVVDGFCRVLDDGGGIYTWAGNDAETPFDSIIEDNIVSNGPGNEAGRPPGAGQAVGIYLDDLAKGLRVRRNTISGAHYGLMLHGSSDVVVENNVLFGNRKHQLVVSDTGIRDPEAMKANVLRANTVVTTGDGVPVFVEATHGQPKLARLEGNAMLRLHGDDALRLTMKIPAGWRTQTLDLPGARQLGLGDIGTLTRRQLLGDGADTALIDAYGLIRNSRFRDGLSGWSLWDKANIARAEVRPGCDGQAPCAVVDYAGADQVILHSHPVHLKQGERYALLVRARAEGEPTPVNFTVRRGGPTYEAVGADTTMILPVHWREVVFPFVAAASLEQARVDIGARGKSRLLVSGVALVRVPAQADDLLGSIRLLTNASASEARIACPEESPGNCRNYQTIDGRPQRWPVAVGPYASVVVVRAHGRVIAEGD